MTWHTRAGKSIFGGSRGEAVRRARGNGDGSVVDVWGASMSVAGYEAARPCRRRRRALAVAGDAVAEIGYNLPQRRGYLKVNRTLQHRASSRISVKYRVFVGI